eukprot:13859374-Alexandrium_andersonii.AAC.1
MQRGTTDVLDKRPPLFGFEGRARLRAQRGAALETTSEAGRQGRAPAGTEKRLGGTSVQTAEVPLL